MPKQKGDRFIFTDENKSVPFLLFYDRLEYHIGETFMQLAQIFLAASTEESAASC
jgi:hypothetical protein